MIYVQFLLMNNKYISVKLLYKLFYLFSKRISNKKIYKLRSIIKKKEKNNITLRLIVFIFLLNYIYISTASDYAYLKE